MSLEVTDQFKLFGWVHVTTLAVIILVAVALVCISRSSGVSRWTPYIDAGLAVVLLSNEIIWLIIAVNLKLWSLQWGLPLQICDLAIFAVAYSLFKQNQVVWELAYFWGLGGTLQALLTPDIVYNFPHYYFFKFFITHGCIIIGVVYLAAGHRRPIFRFSLTRVWIITNLYAGLIGIYNVVFDANFLYLCRKPNKPSLLDFFGPWPYYLVGLEIILVVSLLLYYLPYFIAGRLKRQSI